MELKYEVKEAAETLQEMEKVLQTTLEDLTDLKTTIFNETTPEIEELETLDTCDRGIPVDCCQVCYSVCHSWYSPL